MSNSIKKSTTPKTKINLFYLIKELPFQTFFHYLTGFLSAFLSVKILTEVTKFVAYHSPEAREARSAYQKFFRKY